MEFTYIQSVVILTLSGIAAYFIKFLHKSAQDNSNRMDLIVSRLSERITTNESDIKNIDQKHASAILNMQKLQELEMKHLREYLEKVSEKQDKIYDLLLKLQQN